MLSTPRAGRRNPGWIGAYLWLLFVAFGALPVCAQTQSDASREGARETGAPLDAQAEAKRRFDRGLELYDEGAYEAALAEFKRAYELHPAYQVLFNLGKVYAQLDDPVRAVDALEHYLSEAGARPLAERLGEALELLEKQRQRISVVSVSTNVEPATLMLDGADYGTLPLQRELRLGAGKHLIGARAVGYETAIREVKLAGGVQERVNFELKRLVEARGSLFVTSAVADVEVTIDGRSVGHTPLDESVSLEPGIHRVQGRRRGYKRFDAEVAIAKDTERQLDLQMGLDPRAPAAVMGRLRLMLPAAAYTLRINGRQTQVPNADSAELELPAGRHQVELEVVGRLPVSTRVEVPAQGAVVVAPELMWTPHARQELLDQAQSRRIWGWTLTGVGVGLGALGTWLVLDSDERIANDQTKIDGLKTDRQDFKCQLTGDRCVGSIDEEIDATQQDVAQREWMRIGGAGGAVLGAGIAVAGLVVLLSADSDEAIDGRAGVANASLRSILLPTGWMLQMHADF